MVHVSTTAAFYKLTKFDYVTDDGKRHCHLISYGGGGVVTEEEDDTSAGDVIRIHTRNSNDTKHGSKGTTPFKNEYHVRRLNMSGGDVSSSASISPIRAIACSPDGKRVAVGFDDGSTRIYTYNKVEVKENKHNDDNDNDDEMMLHPFLRSLPKVIKPTTTNDKSSSSTVVDHDDEEDQHYFAGPRVSASIRDLVFDPRSRPCGGASGAGCRRYLLAVATEDHGDGLFVVNVLSPDTVLQDKFLSDDSHSYGGVRSICYSTPPISFSSNESDEESVTFLAALGQDGYITLYCCNGIETPDLSWSEWYRSRRPVVPSKDLGYAIASMTTDTNSDHDNSSKHLLTAYDRAASVSWSPDGKALLLMGGNDVELRSLGVTQPNDLEEPTSLFETPQFLLSNVTQHRGHTNAIVSSTFHMDGTLLITLGKDGRICAWDMDPKSYDSTANSSNTNNSIGRFRCEVEAPISNEEHPISIAFDDTTGLLHVVYTSGTLKTFTSSQLRATQKKSTPPTSLNTTKDPLVEEEDNDEAALETQPPTSSASASMKNPYTKLKTNSNATNTTATAASSLKPSPKNDDDLLLDFDAMNSNAVGSKGKTKSSSSKKSSSKSFIDDEAEADAFDDDDDAFEDFDDGIANLKSSVVSDKEQTQTNGDTGEDTFGGAFQSNDGDFDGEDDDDVMDLTQNDNTATAKNTNALSSNVVLPPQEPPQEAFAPSSTPVNVDHPHVRRILCWNHMGVVTSRRDDVDDEQHIVDINLNDTNLFGGAHQHFLDSFGFDQGTLGEDGGMFATYSGTGDDEEDDDVVDHSLFGTKKKNASTMEGSKLFFYRFDTIGSSKHKDWSATLPTGEHALGVACGEGWAAVVTSRRFLRLFTSGGIQRTMICLQGDPVTIVGRGRLVAVMYHMASPLADKTQQLGYMILDAIECKTLHEGCLNGIQKGQRLTWAGFSNDLSLMIMESSGLVSMLSVSSGWQWVPVLDTLGKKKSMEDSFWPISVLKGNLVCVPLKGGHEHPDATRRPITTTLELRLPLAQGMKQTMDLEDILIRADMALGQKKFSDELLLKSGGSQEDLEDEYHVACAQVDKVTIKLFHAALSANSVERALDLVQLLHGEKSYSILMQVSDQMGYDKVTEKIQQFMEAKFPPQEEPLYSQDEDGSFHDQHFEEDDNHSQRSCNHHDDHHDDENNGPFEDTQTPFLSNRRKVTPNNRNVNNAFFGQTSSTTMNNNEQHDVEEIDDDEIPKTTKTNTKNPFAKSNKRKNNNPFAKTTLQSPTKPLKKIKLNRGGKVISSPPRMQLSRNSTFSVKAKEKQKSMKQFL